MAILDIIINGVNNILWGKNILVVLLIGAAIYFSIRTKFMQFRLLPEIIRSIFSKSSQDSTQDGDSKGVTPFQSFCIGTACRVGAGNIVGVVAAITVGGPGAIFWMWMVALLGSATAFIESTMAVLHRGEDRDGKLQGGTPWIIEKKTGKKYMGAIFSIVSVLCYLGVTQVMSNTIAGSFNAAYSFDKNIITYILTAVVAVIILGKKDKIVNSVNMIVPIMAAIYLGVVAIVIIRNFTLIPEVLKTIVVSAFGGREIVGGVMGGAIMQGVKRGLFSNEAGSGNSNYAAASADSEHPVKQGMVQVLGVFVDTIIICTATAFMILLADKGAIDGKSGTELFQGAVNYHIGWLSGPFTVITVSLFSFSTILGITYYGKKAVSYISNRTMADTIFKVLIILMVLLGGAKENYLVWSLADFGLGVMTLMNLWYIIPHSGEAIKSLREYEEEIALSEEAFNS